MLKLPGETFQVRETLEKELLIFPSMISDPMALWPARDFRKDAVVLRIGGSEHGEWSAFGASSAVENGLSVRLRRKGARTTHLVLNVRKMAARLLHVSSVLPPESTTLALQADWALSSQNPELLRILSRSRAGIPFRCPIWLRESPFVFFWPALTGRSYFVFHNP